MAFTQVSINVSTTGLKPGRALRDILRQVKNPNSTGEVREALRKSALIAVHSYKTSYGRRARGAGGWPDIEESTKIRKGNSLRFMDKKIILNAIKSRQISGGFIVGVFRRTRHPGGGNWSIQRVVKMAAMGRSTPKRKRWRIFTPPTKAVVHITQRLIREAFNKVYARHARR